MKDSPDVVNGIKILLNMRISFGIVITLIKEVTQ